MHVLHAYRHQCLPNLLLTLSLFTTHTYPISHKQAWNSLCIFKLSTRELILFLAYQTLSSKSIWHWNFLSFSVMKFAINNLMIIECLWMYVPRIHRAHKKMKKKIEWINCWVIFGVMMIIGQFMEWVWSTKLHFVSNNSPLDDKL